MKLSPKIRSGFQSDWFIALLLLGLFLFIAGYRYGWDDQHLEIPLLKALIDNSLYPGDYYVTSLKNNFPSYFYPLLSRLITVDQIPTAYFLLYLVSRYFLLFWMYKIWIFISGRKSLAFLCVIIPVSLGRMPEFFYRTFSHQEFALAIIFGGLYLFYKGRYVWASLLLGIAANFHAVYSLFPMIYMGIYMLWQRRTVTWKAIGKAFFTFLVCASPVIIWAMQKRFMLPAEISHEPATWLPIYRLACPPNFIFDGVSLSYLFKSPSQWLLVAQKEVLLIILFFFNLIFNEQFQSDKKSRAIIFGAFILLAVSYVFTYVQPSRFMLDLNIVRNVQFLSFILTGYLVLFTINLINQEKNYLGYCAAIVVSCLIFDPHLATTSLIGLSLLLLWQKTREDRPRHAFDVFVTVILSLGLLIWGWFTYKIFSHLMKTGYLFLATIIIEASLILFVLQLRQIERFRPAVKKLLIILPLISLIFYRGYNHLKFYVQETRPHAGFWKLQHDWEDMQRYVRDNTPKTATVLAPHDMEMGGFRILADRTIVACDRDIGIIGFDYPAAVECLRRLHDIEPLKVVLTRSIDPQDMLKWIVQYHVDYIVYMRYYAPKEEQGGAYQKIHENDNFSLFQVRPETLKHLSKLSL